MEDTRLGTLLLEHGIVPETVLRQCLEIQALAGDQRPLGEVLVEQGAVSARTLTELLEIQRRRREQTVAPIAIESDHSDRFLRTALDSGASELILSEGRIPLVRLGGDLRQLGSDPLAGPEVWNFVREHMGFAVLEEIAESYTVTRSLILDGRVRGRISAFRHFDGLAVRVRLQPQTVRDPVAAGIDEAIVSALRSGKGLMLLAGEQGAGVTGAFASLLHVVAQEAGRSIVVLDRTFEYPEPSGPAMVSMRRVGEHTKDFTTGMRAALQEQADVVFLGEVESTTFDLALHAAEVGALVVATVRARSATRALERVLRFRPPYDEARVRGTLASVLLGVLVVQVVPDADHSGARLATEVLLPDEGVRGLIRSGDLRRLGALLRMAKDGCGHDLDSSLGALVTAGAVRFEDAFQYADDKARLLQTDRSPQETE